MLRTNRLLTILVPVLCLGAVPRPGNAGEDGAAAWFIDGLVVNETGSAVGKVPVRAFAAESEPLPGAEPQIAASTETDGDGHFTLTGLAPSTRYAVVAQPAADAVGVMVRTVAWSKSKMERSIVLPLRVGTTLAGRVVDAGGAPAKALLQAMEGAWPAPYWGYEAAQQEVGWRTSWVAADAEGNFVLKGVPRGACLLRCSAPSVGDITMYASPSRADLRVPLRRVDGAGLSGVVRGPKGGVGRARVSVAWRADATDIDSVRAETLTGVDGSYAIAGVGPGWIEMLEVETPGLLLPDSSRWDWKDVRLETKGSVRVDLTLVEPCTIEGTVRDATGKGLAGTTLTTYLAGGRGADAGTRTATSASDGSYRFTNLAVCKGQVRPAKDGFTWTKPTADPTTAEAHYDGGGSCFFLRRPGTSVRLDFVLDRQTESESRAPLKGRVVDASGAPVAGARLRLSPQRWSSSERTPYPDPVTSDATGRFLFPAVARDRKWSVYASTEDQVEKAPVWDCEAGQEAEVVITMRPAKLTAGRVVDEQGKPVARVNVEAWAFAGGFSSGPPPSRRLLVRTTTDALGQFKLLEAEDDIAPILKVYGWQLEQTDTASGLFESDDKEPGLPVKVATDLVLHVRHIQPLILEGLVQDPDGKPAAWRSLGFGVIEAQGAQRHHWPRPGVWARESWSTVTDERGWFRLSRAAGDPTASAFVCAELAEDHQVLEPGVQTTPLRLAKAPAEAPPLVAGRVAAPDGTPVERAWVTLGRGRPAIVRGGEFRAEYPLSSDDSTWWIGSAARADGTPRSDVEEMVNGTLSRPFSEPVILTLPRAQQRRGRVVDREGKGVPGVVVDAFVRDTHWSGAIDNGAALHAEWTVTDANGSFHLGRLDGASITVRVYPQWTGAKPVEVPATDEATALEVRIER